MSRFRVTADHAVDLDDGRVVDPGDDVELTVSEDSPVAAALVEQGWLTPMQSDSTPQPAPSAWQTPAEPTHDDTEDDHQ